MEHIEEAGIHSGDSCCTLPAWSLPEKTQAELRESTRRLAEALEVRGLMNVQYAVKGDRVYLIEVNPRASRTVPYVSKAIGVPLARLAARVMAGEDLRGLGFTEEVIPPHISVKEPVFPFNRFPGVDIVLGPEMRSTGEVMGIDLDLGAAFAKAKLAAYLRLPRKGTVFLSVKDADKRSAVGIAQRLVRLGYGIVATEGTYTVLRRSNVPCDLVHKIAEGRRPNVLDKVKNRDIALVMNTPSGRGARTDEGRIRAAAVGLNIPVITTMSGAAAATLALEAIHRAELEVRPLQDWLAFRRKAPAGVPSPT
jgi:carbamoyl-phosphate synthase large subunit